MPNPTPFRTAQSYLTGRTIHVNTSAEFAVPPTFSVESMALFAEVLAQHIRDSPSKGRPSLTLRAHLVGITEITAPSQLLALVHRLLDFVSEKPRRHDVVHVREVLRRLWHFNLLAWPLLPNKRARAFLLTKNWLWEPERKELFDSLVKLNTNESSANRRIRGVMTLVMASAGSMDIGDFTPEVAGDYFFSVLEHINIRHKVVLDVIYLQQLKYDSKVVHVLKNYGPFGRIAVRPHDASYQINMHNQPLFRTAQSYLTGRTIHVNTSAEFAVPPTFSVESMALFAEVLDQHIQDTPTKNRHSLALRAYLTGLAEINVPSQLLALVHRLLDFVAEKPSQHDVIHVREILRRLWHFNLLTWPLLPNEQAQAFLLNKKWLWEPERKELFDSVAALGANGHVGTSNKRIRAVMTLVMASAGSVDIGDFTPEVAGDYFYSVLRPTTIRQKVVVDVISLQYLKYDSKVVHVLKNYGSFGRMPVRADDKFQWVLAVDSSLVVWVDRAALFMESVASNRSKYRAACNRLFDFLIEHSEVTRVPEEYLRRDYVSPALYHLQSESHESALYALFEFILETRCTGEDDHGYKVRVPGYCNPIEVRSRPKRAAETHREAMPTRFVRMLYDILVADDFAWPKKFGAVRWNGKGGDSFMWLNPETGEPEIVWSPVRMTALLIKLLLPARSFQVRMLDSGEADTAEYDLDTNTWVKNVGHLAPPKGKLVAKGVFARHRDNDGQEYIFIRFNTNKTADQNKEGAEAGYVMPWQHTEAIRRLSFLRDWQKKYNPINVPTRWVDIKDGSISTTYTREALEAKGSNCFLFRDPCLPHRDQPVTDARLNIMWRNVNLELERRLAQAGETMPDGSPIVLVEKTVAGRPIYDLHTLRVTLITALAESGGVPPSVLMKVVGHSSVIMTFYYMKLSPTHICEQLNKAELKLFNQEQMNWQAWLAHQTRETLVSAVAHTSPTALEAMTKSSPTSWVIRDHGICPVGCARCHEGGEAIVDTKAYQKWGPVQGGATNCVRCRFFITGPAFLLGLQAYFDNIGYKLKESSERYQAAKANFEDMEAAYVAKQSRGAPTTKQETHQLTVASSHFDQRTTEVDNLAHAWHATHRLVQQCLHIIHTAKDQPATNNQQYALVAAGGLANIEAVLEQSSDFEQVDRICQSAVFFEGIDSTTPNLKRMRAFDAMLKRNGLNPVFIDLDERSALEAGNQMAAFMYARFGRDSTNALMVGKETLRRLGVEEEMTRQLETIIPLRLSPGLGIPRAAIDVPKMGKERLYDDAI